MERAKHLESGWPYLSPDIETKLKSQFPHLQNGIITTVLTVLFQSLIVAMPQTKTHAFPTAVHFLAHTWH